jgi:hypothetical protein
MATFSDYAAQDEGLMAEARANSEHLLEHGLVGAFRDYGDDRSKRAHDEMLNARLAEALRDGATLDEARRNPRAEADHDARRAADAARAAREAHGTVSDEDEDIVQTSSPDATHAECLAAAECLHRCEMLKKEGNAAFKACCVELDEAKARDVAMDAAIYYLDVLDAIYLAEQRPMAPDQRDAMRAMKLATLLNRGAALNKQLDWKLSLKACNAALMLEPDSVKGLYRRAVALAGLEQGEEAEGDLRRVLAMAPENRDAQRRLRELRKVMKAKPPKKPKVPPLRPKQEEAEFTFSDYEDLVERKRLEADYDAANAAVARARAAHPPPPSPPAPAPTEADLAFAEAVAAADRIPRPAFDPYDVVGLDGDGASTGADFDRAFEEDLERAAREGAADPEG